MNKIKDLIELSDTILVLCHKNPDGDAIGSGLAVYNALLNMYKKVDIIIENVPRIFNFLSNANRIKNTSKIENYDLVIVLDCSSQERIGQDNNYFENAKYTLNIDHHISNTNYANYNYISSKSPACCEYLIEILDYLNIEITKEIAECLMVGILTDTGGFQYCNVGEKTYNFASRVSKIIDIPSIYKKVLTTKTKAQFELSKIAMSRIELLNNDKIAFTYLTQEDLEKVNAMSGDHEGIVEFGRDVEGVEVSIFLKEIENGYRVSLRSNGSVDVNEIAKIFNGGGHKYSSGFESNLAFKDLKEKLIKSISEWMKQ